MKFSAAIRNWRSTVAGSRSQLFSVHEGLPDPRSPALQPLFAPETIGRYLGVKWSDNSTFLLTWIGPDTMPIGPDFLDAYTRLRAAPTPCNGSSSTSLPR